MGDLYVIALYSQETADPNICQKLEQLVLDGQKALSPVINQRRTPKDFIFHTLYGKASEAGYFDSFGEWKMAERNIIDGMWYSTTQDYVQLDFRLSGTGMEASCGGDGSLHS